MKIDFKGLIEGIRNTYFPAKEIREQILQTSKERLEVCNGCEYFSPNANYTGPRPDVHCMNCGCNLEFKSKCLSCSCPQGKWEALITEAEEQALTKKINEAAKSNP